MSKDQQPHMDIKECRAEAINLLNANDTNAEKEVDKIILWIELIISAENNYPDKVILLERINRIEQSSQILFTELQSIQNDSNFMNPLYAEGAFIRNTRDTSDNFHEKNLQHFIQLAKGLKDAANSAYHKVKNDSRKKSRSTLSNISAKRTLVKECMEIFEKYNPRQISSTEDGTFDRFCRNIYMTATQQEYLKSFRKIITQELKNKKDAP